MIPKLKCLIIYITHGCNLRCKHCWISAGKQLDNEISLDDIKRTLKEAYNIGLESVNITGGEPFPT